MKTKRKSFTAMLVAFAVLAVMVANASAEVGWAQSVVRIHAGAIPLIGADENAVGDVCQGCKYCGAEI